MTKPAVSSIVLVIVSSVPALAGDAAPVPEPATIALVGAGLAGVILWSRRRGSKK